MFLSHLQAVILGIALIACGSNNPVGPGEEEESGTQYRLSDTATETRSGITLVMSYDNQKEAFTGKLTNTSSETVQQVRVEIHLSNGQELGPTSRINMSPGQETNVTLDGRGQRFDRWSVHIEIGSSEH